MATAKKLLAAVAIPLGALCSQVWANPPMAEFVRVPNVIDTEISPSGRYLAQIRDKDDARMLVVLDLEAPGTPVVGRLVDRFARAYDVNWASDDRLLITARTPYESERALKRAEKDEDFDIREYATFTRIIAMNVDASDVVVLLGNDRHARSNRRLSTISHFLPDDPEHILMPHYREDRLMLSKVNIYTGDHEVLAKGGRFTVDFVADSGGRPKYRIDYLRIAKRINIYQLKADGEGQEWTEVGHIDFDETRENEAFDEARLVGLLDGDLVYRSPNGTTGYNELTVYDPEAKTTRVLVSLPDKDVVGPVVYAKTNEIAGYSVLQGTKRYVYFNEEDQRRYDALAKHFEGENFFATSHTNDGKKSVIFSYGPSNPGAYYLYNRETKDLALLSLAYFNLRQEDLSASVKAKFPTRDGMVLGNL
jgi:dipeptidyl aminopeptidase/acylaminoacyl peptidase